MTDCIILPDKDISHDPQQLGAFLAKACAAPITVERKDITDLYSPNRHFSAFKWLAKGLTDLRGVCRCRDHEGKSTERKGDMKVALDALAVHFIL